MTTKWREELQEEERDETLRKRRAGEEIKTAGFSVCMSSVSHCSAWMSCSDDTEVSVGEGESENGGASTSVNAESEEARRSFYINEMMHTEKRNRWMRRQIMPGVIVVFFTHTGGWNQKNKTLSTSQNNRWGLLHGTRLQNSVYKGFIEQISSLIRDLLTRCSNGLKWLWTRLLFHMLKLYSGSLDMPITIFRLG